MDVASSLAPTPGYGPRELGFRDSERKREHALPRYSKLAPLQLHLELQNTPMIYMPRTLPAPIPMVFAQYMHCDSVSSFQLSQVKYIVF